MGGFECSCQINSAGVRLDMIAALQHDRNAAADYRRLREVGIAAARDGVRWHLIDRGGAYDWSSWIPMLEAARDAGVQVIWDLCHYGWPDDLDFFSPAFVDRYARFTKAAACVHRDHLDEPAFFAPVNEISFFAWAASRDLMFPYALGRGDQIKRQMVRAALAAIDAIHSVEPRARLVFPEPLIHNVPPRWRPWNTGPARAQRASQFEAWDMIAGRMAPELGGNEQSLDIVGVNFYAANQWEVPGGRKLNWDGGSDDPRWVPLHRLLAEVYSRYRRPLFIAETSHYGAGRAAWLEEIARESEAAVRQGVPLEGVCLYPILDRFDWEDPAHWHHSGLWDMVPDGAGSYRRELNAEYSRALRAAQLRVRAHFYTLAG
jgi:beta-glucosidase/6-phospho-beta-glucosidase/beta-galactosidase